MTNSNPDELKIKEYGFLMETRFYNLKFDCREKYFYFELNMNNDERTGNNDTVYDIFRKIASLPKYQRSFFFHPISISKSGKPERFTFCPGLNICSLLYGLGERNKNKELKSSFNAKEYIIQWAFSIACAIYIFHIQFNQQISSLSSKCVFIDENLRTRVVFSRISTNTIDNMTSFYTPKFYYAPEYYEEQEEESAKTDDFGSEEGKQQDMYAFGVLVNELVEGEPPENPLIGIKGRREKNKIMKEQNSFPRRSDKNHPLSALIVECLQKDPNKRMKIKEAVETIFEKCKDHQNFIEHIRAVLEFKENEAITKEGIIKRLNGSLKASGEILSYKGLSIEELEKASKNGLKESVDKIIQLCNDEIIKTKYFSNFPKSYINMLLSKFNIAENDKFALFNFLVDLRRINLFSDCSSNKFLYNQDDMDDELPFVVYFSYDQQKFLFFTPKISLYSNESQLLESSILQNRFPSSTYIVRPINANKIDFYPFLNMYNYLYFDGQSFLNDLSKTDCLLSITRAFIEIHSQNFSFLTLSSKSVFIDYDPSSKQYFSKLYVQRLYGTINQGIISKLKEEFNEKDNFSIYYRAPELFPIYDRNYKCEIDLQKCDIFSFGILLYEVFFSKKPNTLFNDSVNLENRVRYLKFFSENIKKKSKIEDLPGESKIRDLIRKCTEAEPGNRPNFIEINKSLNDIRKDLSNSKREDDKNKNECKFEDLELADRKGAFTPSKIADIFIKNLTQEDYLYICNYKINYSTTIYQCLKDLFQIQSKNLKEPKKPIIKFLPINNEIMENLLLKRKEKQRAEPNSTNFDYYNYGKNMRIATINQVANDREKKKSQCTVNLSRMMTIRCISQIRRTLIDQYPFGENRLVYKINNEYEYGDKIVKKNIKYILEKGFKQHNIKTEDASNGDVTVTQNISK